MAKTIEELMQRAKIGSANSFKKNGSYNFSYKLSQEQIEIAALLQIDPDLEEARKKCYINGFSLRDMQGPIDIQALFSAEDSSLLNAAFNITDSINAAKDGKPAFFVVEDKGHYVTVALVPDTKDPQKMSVQYINSITEPDPELVKEQVALENELDAIPEHQRESEEAQLLQVRIASISDTIAEQERMSGVGKNFATELLGYLKKEKIALSSENVLDRSNDQQLGNCCGLSVASNVAAITTNKPLFSPKEPSEKMHFYDALGVRVFSYIESWTSGVKSKLSVGTPTASLSVANSDSEIPKTKAKKDATIQLSPLAKQIAATIIANHDLFKDKTKISKSDFANAINNSQSLGAIDRKSFNLLVNTMGDKTYSKTEMTKLIADSDFVKVQVAAVQQIRQRKHNSDFKPKPSVTSRKKVTGHVNVR